MFDFFSYGSSTATKVERSGAVGVCRRISNVGIQASPVPPKLPTETQVSASSTSLLRVKSVWRKCSSLLVGRYFKRSSILQSTLHPDDGFGSLLKLRMTAPKRVSSTGTGER